MLTLGYKASAEQFAPRELVEIAQAFAILGCLNPGRVFLGIGTGEALNEIATGFQGAGEQVWPEFRKRFARLRESVRLIRTLWTGERISFEGDYYSTHEASIYDVPEGGIPIYIAAGWPTVAKYAGRAGDGFICTSGKGRELYEEKLVPAVKEGLAASGRELSDIDRMIEIKISYEETEEAARENTRFWAPLSLSAEQMHDITDPVEMEKAADALPIEQIAKRWIVGTDPDAVVAQVKDYVDWGFNHFVFHALGHDQERFMTLFERDLAPRPRG